jgi:hypothetical protein
MDVQYRYRLSCMDAIILRILRVYTRYVLHSFIYHHETRYVSLHQKEYVHIGYNE